MGSVDVNYLRRLRRRAQKLDLLIRRDGDRWLLIDRESGYVVAGYVYRPEEDAGGA